MGKVKDFFRFYSQSPNGSVGRYVGVTHLQWLSVTIILIILFVFIYSKQKKHIKISIMRINAYTLLCTEIFRTIWAVSIHHYKLDSMLPLHLCGIMIFVEFFAVVYNNKLLMEFSYYCGLPGAVIGLLTPELNGYVFFSFQNLNYILRHGLLVLIPLLWIFGNGLRPSKIGGRKAFLMLSLLALVDAIVNALLKGNYLFISKVPQNSFLQSAFRNRGYLSYILFVIVGVIIIIYLLYLPWKFSYKYKYSRKL